MSGGAGIPVILRGDTARGVEIALAEGYDYGGCALEAELCGVRRAFSGLAAGGVLALGFTADETAAFPLGTSRVRLSLRNAAGEVRSLPWAKVKVTDAPGEVYAARIPADPGALDVGDLTAADGLGAVKERVNAVLAFLRGGTACLALLAAADGLAGAAPLFARLDDVPGDAPVLTNAAEYAAALVASATDGLLRAEADPAFRAWTNGTEVAAGAGAVAAHASVAIGSGAETSDEDAPMYVGAVAVGQNSAARGHGSVAVGNGAAASGAQSVALGALAGVTDAVAVAIGPGARSHGEGTFSVHAADPSKFFLGSSSLQSFLDAEAAQLPSFGDLAAYETKADAAASWYPKDEGELWAAWWSGDSFRVTVTNYNVEPGPGVAWSRLPSARFEYRPDGTNALRAVWDEETKWARWREAFAAYTNEAAAALDLKAGLDWGRTTPTGFDAPEGFTWLDTPATVISGGLAWQRTLTSEGAVWVLSSNGMAAQFGTDGASTNGYFRISDERGEAAFEVVAGGKVTVGAKAESVFPWTAEDGRTRLRVVYDVESDAAPTLHAAAKLLPGGATDWREPGAEGCAAEAAGWTGGRGAWTNAVWLAEAPAAGATHSLFVYATYETGAEPVVRNLAPVQMEKIVLGGKTWTLGTATISGKTVLTLEEAAP